MRTNLIAKFTLAAVTTGLLALTAPRALAQTVDDFEGVRDVIRADRKTAFAEGMHLTEKEGAAFWPIFDAYEAEMIKIGDAQLNAIIEYSDFYPDIPEDRAESLLKQVIKLDKEYYSLRGKTLKQLGKVLPTSKVLRFAQLETRYHLGLQLKMSKQIPLVPVKKTH